MPKSYTEISKNYTKAQRHYSCTLKSHLKRNTPITTSLLEKAASEYIPIRDETILFAISHNNAEETKELIKLMFNSNGNPDEALSNGDMPINLARAAGNDVVIELLNKIMRINDGIEAMNQSSSTLFARVHEAASLEDQITINRTKMQSDVTSVIETATDSVIAGMS